MPLLFAYGINRFSHDVVHFIFLCRGAGLTRAAYAKLYSVGFAPVLDRNGEPPEVIDPNTHIVTVDMKREMSDPLQCNEIVFQFLAFSK